MSMSHVPPAVPSPPMPRPYLPTPPAMRAAPAEASSLWAFSTPGVLVAGWVVLVVFVLSHVWVAVGPGATFLATGLIKIMLAGMGLGLMSRGLRVEAEPIGRAGLVVAGAILLFAALGNALWVMPGSLG